MPEPALTDQQASHRRIRTFHPRRSRTTPRAARALAAMLRTHAVEINELPERPAALFSPELPVALEIGPGMGSATLTMAQREPGIGILAVDVHTPGIGALLAGVAELQLTNVRVVIGDALEVMDRLAPASLVAVRAYFPDPWPKVRHHKRRLVNDAFVHRCATLLAPGGRLHLATDIDNYAAAMLAACAREPLLSNTSRDGFLPAPTDRPVTKYERRANDANRVCRDVLFIRGGAEEGP